MKYVAFLCFFLFSLVPDKGMADDVLLVNMQKLGGPPQISSDKIKVKSLATEYASLCRKGANGDVSIDKINEKFNPRPSDEEKERARKNSFTKEKMELRDFLVKVSVFCEKINSTANFDEEIDIVLLQDLYCLWQSNLDEFNVYIDDAINSRVTSVSLNCPKVVNSKKDRETKGNRDGGARFSRNIVTPNLFVPASIEQKLIEGLAKFVVDRAKAEAALVLKDKIYKKLCEEKNTVISLLAPNVCFVLGDLDSTLSLQSLTEFLSSAAKRDMLNFPDVLLRAAIATQPKKAGELSLLRVMLAMFQSIQKGNEPLQSFQNISLMELMSCETGVKINKIEATCKEELQSLRLASFWFRFLSYQSVWDTKGTEPIETQELVYRSASALFSFLDEYENSKIKWIAKENGMGSLVSNCLDGKIEKFKDKCVLNMANALLKGLSSFQTVKDEFKIYKNVTAPEEKAASLLRLSSAVISMGATIQEEISFLSIDETEKKIININEIKYSIDLGVAIIEKNYTEIFYISKKMFDESGLTSASSGPLAIIASIANAKDAEEVAKIIEVAAAPVGSFRLKYQRPMLTVNALLGVSGFTENAIGLDDKFVYSFAPLTPVGFHGTTPVGKKNRLHLGGMVSILDISAATTDIIQKELELDSGEKAKSQNSLEQVFSPGLYGTIGFTKKIPLLLGVGASFIPNGRVVTSGEGDAQQTDTFNVWRAGLFLAMDVTIFAF